MKVLVFNGSPKGERSNTLRLTKAFVDGIGRETAADVEMLDLNKLSLRECTGCFSCWSKTPGKCIFDDDMTAVMQKLIEADIVIWSFPLYHFSVPSRMKLLMDRQLPLYLPFMESSTQSGGHRARYDMSGKRHAVISTCGFYTAQGNYDSVTAQFDKLYGAGGYAKVFCGQGELFRVPELRTRTDEYLETVKEAGAEFVAGGISKDTLDRLAVLLYPREVFESMADASWGVDDGGSAHENEALVFTRQMAALYNKSSWKGRDSVLEFHYTDVDKTYQILMGKDGHKVLTDGFLPSTTRIETPLSVWQSIARGEISGQQAMMDRLYRVTGDFDIMLRWDDYFGAASQPQERISAPKKQKKSNMLAMLLPWMVIWILLPIDAKAGAAAGIAVCAVIPIAYLWLQGTVFEYLTIPAVTAVSLLALLGYPINPLLIASYLAFGLMWLVTAFMKLPLSAYYSMHSYGGEKALENPLFLRTNRILTACWGVLYLIISAWTVFLLNSPLASMAGAVNSILPAVMGVFTVWFQRWYPKHYAAKA